MTYLLHILILIGIYSILAHSLNLMAGYAGMVSLAHAAFYGIGAYMAALLSLLAGFSFIAVLGFSVLFSVIIGFIVGIPGTRINDETFIIATFSFQVIVYSLMNNWTALTGGTAGLAGIPQATLFGWNISSHLAFFALLVPLAALSVLFSFFIVRSPFGRTLKGIREDQVLVLSFGKNVIIIKNILFAISAGMAALAGCLYAYYISFIDPLSFTITESIFVLTIVIVGGAGSLWGPVAGTVLLVALPELLRLIGMPTAIAANFRQILYGGLLVAFAMWRPNGLIGKYSFEKHR